MGRQSPVLKLGLGGTHQHNMDYQKRQQTDTVSSRRSRHKNWTSVPTLALLALDSLCKLSYLPGKWVWNAFSKRKCLSPGKTGCWLWGKIEFSCLSGHVSMLPQWEINIFIKPDIIQHDHDPLLFGKNTLDLYALALLLTLSLTCNVIFS